MSNLNDIKMCRVCLNKLNILTNIFLTNSDNILRKLRDFVEVKDETEDDHPKYICEVCVANLNSSFEFKEECQNGFEKIQEMIFAKSNLNTILFEAEKTDFEETDVKPKLDPLLEEQDYKFDVIETFKVKEEITEEVVTPPHQSSSSSVTPPPIKFHCLECDQSFYFPKQLRIHKKTHTEVKLYDCNYCDLKFEKITESRNHVKEVHGHKCKICDKEFKTNSRLNTHTRTVHPVENDQFECELCFKKIKFRNSLRRHMKSVHQKEKKHFCNLCSAGFYEIGTLKLHMGSHLTTRDFVCQVCQKDFKTKSHLGIHMKVHQEPKTDSNSDITTFKFNKAPIKKNQFICQYCGKMFNYRTCYDVHIRIHTKQSPFKCDVCGKGFRNKQVLVTHKMIHTGEKPHKCEICKVSFRQSIHLKYHSVIHTGEKKFKCDICGISVAYKSSLLAHNKNVHQGLRPYECNICQKQFFTNGNLKKHLVNHNK